MIDPPSIESTESTEPTEVPAPPRPLTSAARKRAWAESPVRVWMVLTGLVAIITLYLATTLLMTGLSQRRLIESGEKVIAQIVQLNGTNVPTTRAFRRESPLAVVRFTLADARAQRVEMNLSPGEPDEVHMNDQIELRVDPANPDHPTDRKAASPWLSELAVPMMLTPIVILCGLVMSMKKNSVLKVWRDGEEQVGVVMDSKQSAIAPRSKVLQFALRDAQDRRVFSLLYPLSAGRINKGDELLLICPKDNPARAILADLYL